MEKRRIIPFDHHDYQCKRIADRLYPIALRILVQITRQIKRIDISHNLLGNDGIVTLLKGLSSLRGRFTSPELGIWGLGEMNLASNGLGDAALDAVLGYVKKDVMVRRVYMQANDIEVSLSTGN